MGLPIPKSLFYRILAVCAIHYLAFAFLQSRQKKSPSQNPEVKVRNGTYTGVYSPGNGQDFFLGVPYAQAPIGEGRFRPPQHLNHSWHGSRQANEYGPSCIGYGPDSNHYPLSEDCLTLNIIRPHNARKDSKLLPVAVWIHGGGFFTGGSRDERYNMTHLVHASVKENQSIIGVSLNYRLSAFGWLWSEEVKRNGGSANVGFLDQRLALQWIQENIESFGGDPSRVVIFGESAGAQSVGMHLIAYGGRGDNLFRAAIMQSGSCLQRWPIWVGNATTYREEAYKNLTVATGCVATSNPYDCLVRLPLERLNAALNVTDTWMPGTGLGPFLVTYDGDIIQDYPSKLVEQGLFVKVPILYGTNTDEGTVNGRMDLVSSDDFRGALSRAGLDETTTEMLASLYPDDDSIGIPAKFHHSSQTDCLQAQTNHCRLPGRQWKRISALYGDASQHAPRRAMVKAWTKYHAPAYSYRFDITPAGVPEYLGATHTVEIPFVFNNLDGFGYKVNPFGTAESPHRHAFHDASLLMSRMWISFINSLDPNDHLHTGYPTWPTYISGEPDNNGQNFVFALDEEGMGFSPYVEADDWRRISISYIQDNAVEHWAR